MKPIAMHTVRAWIAIITYILGFLNNEAFADSAPSYPGLIIKSDRFEAVWPAAQGNVNSYSVTWQVNETNPTKKHYGPTEHSSELITSDHCAKLSVTVTADIDGHATAQPNPITFASTRGLPIKPEISYNDEGLHVDWSRNWPCGATIYRLAVISKSGENIYSVDVEKTSHTVADWKHCEPTDLCITAYGVDASHLGHVCVEDLLPNRRGKPTDVQVKPEGNNLHISWKLADACEPLILNILLKSTSDSIILSTLPSNHRYLLVQKPKECKICLIYVIASYGNFHDEISEAAVYSPPEYNLYPNPGPQWDNILEVCEGDHFNILHSTTDKASIVPFQIQHTHGSLSENRIHALWSSVTKCPILQFRLQTFNPEGRAPRKEAFIDGHTCVALRTETTIHLTAIGLTTNNQNIASSLVKLNSNPTGHVVLSYKICSVNRREMYIEQLSEAESKLPGLRWL